MFFFINYNLIVYRDDSRTAEEYKITGGAVLHLVLALRGGF